MSGIVGLVTNNEKPIDEAAFADMLFMLERQGPDDQAYWKNDIVALGHTLLRVTRESEQEAQPSTLDGKIWITADARIDGQDELISKMLSKGVNLRPELTDDYLILHAYMLWGKDCLNHLIGDFAFIIWDERNQQLFCATDHIGVSPLYYASISDGIVVSNNVSAIRAHPAVNDTLNDQALGDYLLFRMNHTPDSTSFKDIKKLPAGHSLVVVNGQIDIQRYWSVPQPEFVRRSQSQYIEEFRHIFKQSVSDRMRSDTAGTHLSGGMDSTSIAAVLAELRDDGEATGIEAYTHEPAIERLSLERPFAEKVAQKLNIPLNIYTGDNEMPKADIDDIADIPPEPSFGSRATPRFDIFSDSAEKSRIFFTGYGGDPLMMPLKSYWADLRKNANFGIHIIDLVKHVKIHGKPPHTAIPKWMQRRKKSTDAVSRQPLPSWLNEDFAKKNDLIDRYQQLRGSASVNQNARIDMQAHPLWRRVFEWHSPAYSSLPMKIYFPFFDIRLIEWTQAIPPYPWMHSKYLLRAIMEDRLPSEVLERAKTAFPGNQLIAKIEEQGAPDWSHAVSNANDIKRFINIDKFVENANNCKMLTNADTKGITRVMKFNHWLNNHSRLSGYIRSNHGKLQKYKSRNWR